VGYDGRTGKVTVSFRSVAVRRRWSDESRPDTRVEITIKAAKGRLEWQSRKSNNASEAPSLPRTARLVALAIKFQGMVDRGEVRDYADIARLGCATRARITQIMNLANLDRCTAN
jgi:hypothetical protein